MLAEVGRGEREGEREGKRKGKRGEGKREKDSNGFQSNHKQILGGFGEG